MIKSLSVRGLNHRIDADLEFNEDLNIITGKNGAGKTTLLKLLWYLISGNLERIFPEISFETVSLSTVSFDVSIQQNKLGEITLFSTLLGETGLTTATPINVLNDTLQELTEQIALATQGSLFFPTFRRIEGGLRSGGLGSVAELEMDQLQTLMSELSDDLSVYDHKYIASISTNDIGELLTQKYANINKEISDRQARLLSEISQKIQGSSSEEIVAKTSQAVPSILADIQEVADERDRLNKPFSVLSELTQSILQYEAIRVVSRDVLGEASNEITLGKGTDGATLAGTRKAIASDKLSSGEKQMLGFLCYNAFSENTIIFIDEPEISLHVDWQRILLPTLLEQGTDNQFFIATHSPFIYAKYPDKEIPLGDKGGTN